MNEDALTLIEAACVLPMTDGWHLAIRARFADVTIGKPKGVDYGLVLMDANNERVLGFDNSHQYDGSPLNAPWDHEHRVGLPGRTYRYDYTDAWTLLADFWDRVEKYIIEHQARTGVELKFLKEGGTA